MPRYFTYCFNRKGAAALAGRDGEPLRQIWGSRFAGIQAGDQIYIISVQSGRLQLICRLTVGTVDVQGGQIQASQSTPVAITRVLDIETVARLRFNNRKEPVPARMNEEGLLDPQTLRGVRELTPESAALLDRLLGDVQLAAQDNRRALSVRQPWAELIMRGIKTVEVRSQATKVRERVHIYASPVRLDPAKERRLARRYSLDVDPLPRGVLVGTVAVVGCRPLTRQDSQAACYPISAAQGYAWLLADPRPASEHLRPRRRPQPIWFYPFEEP